MPKYLTEQDEQNYGRDLIDFSMRAAAQAVAPAVQDLQQQNAALQQQLARETRQRLDMQVAQAVPDYQEIDRDPRWLRFLLETDPLSGCPRQQLLNDAIAHGDVYRVVAFFRGFLNEYRTTNGGVSSTATPRSRTTRSAPSGTVYTNESIKALYEQRRRGKITDADWARIENDIFAAQKEGRVAATPYWTK